MKVKIGPYINWVGPYQIADAIFWWQDKYSDTCLWAQRANRFGNWLAERKDGSDTYLMQFCNWVQSVRKRQVYVKLDKYDTWNMNHTLALITLPMLKQLKATKHGAPTVEDSDVPSPLRSTAPGAKDKCENEWDIDDNHFFRWDYVLNEMIWAFEQESDDNSEDQFYDHGEKIPGEDLMASVERMKVDNEGLKAHYARKQNGFRLFGKYYQNLWD
jgi:hypothetical protein